MMETKKEVRYFTIFNHEDEQEYLRQNHMAGWKFVKVTGLGMYHFEKCEPEDVIYQLDYNKEGLAQKNEYVQMFSDCGWEYIQDFFGYSYFRKSAKMMDGEEEIFNDDSSKMAMMERVYKGRLIPLLITFCLLLIPQTIRTLLEGQYVLAVFMGSASIVYFVFFIYCAIHYNRKKR